jgi:hypothetical protein
MNDRITLLALQASDPKTGWLDRQKFAELIVRECQFAIVSRTDLPKHERKLYNNVLKKHFGVET